MKIEVYSDGSATTSDKPGGYGWVMVVDGAKTSEGNGHMPNASNNDAELEAAIQGLVAAYKYILSRTSAPSSDPISHGEAYQTSVTLVSDSQLILGWADGQYKFKQSAKMEQFQKLRGLVARMSVKTRWVRGHSGDEHNERCDTLANEARTGIEKNQKREIAKENGETLVGTKKTGVVCVWYKNCLKVVDLDTNIVEDYKREIHGPRGSMLEIREEKSR